jgi:hypothetical protein
MVRKKSLVEMCPCRVKLDIEKFCATSMNTSISGLLFNGCFWKSGTTYLHELVEIEVNGK